MNKRYEMNFQALLAWIAAKTGEMRKRDFANSLEGVTNDFRIFSTYRTKEKPPKAKEKVNIEASYFEIEMKLKELNQPAYVPPEGHRVGDIEQVSYSIHAGWFKSKALILGTMQQILYVFSVLWSL